MTTSFSSDVFPRRLLLCKVTARLALALVWIYEGLVPKILFPAVHPEQTALVLRTGLFWGSPERTLWWLGVAMVITGAILLTGWAERAMAALTTVGMAVLIGLVAYGRPEMLTDPFGALIKDACLVACALTVWWLAPLLKDASILSRV